MNRFHRTVWALVLLVAAAACQTVLAVDAALPSWNDGMAKQAIIAFVDKVTKEGGPDFVPPEERIATFDNDGTLWCEQPMYFQMIFAFDRIKAVSKNHPEWKDTEPYKFVLAGDLKKLRRRARKDCSMSWRLRIRECPSRSFMPS